MLSYHISYSDDLQIYTYQKHFSNIGFKASKIHLKIRRFFFGSVYMYKQNPFVYTLKTHQSISISKKPNSKPEIM